MGSEKRGDLMSPRTGRPKTENPKKYEIKIRYDEELRKALVAYCEENDVTRVEAFRQGLKLLLGLK